MRYLSVFLACLAVACSGDGSVEPEQPQIWGEWHGVTVWEEADLEVIYLITSEPQGRAGLWVAFFKDFAGRPWRHYSWQKSVTGLTINGRSVQLQERIQVEGIAPFTSSISGELRGANGDTIAAIITSGFRPEFVETQPGVTTGVRLVDAPPTPFAVTLVRTR